MSCHSCVTQWVTSELFTGHKPLTNGYTTKEKAPPSHETLTVYKSSGEYGAYKSSYLLWWGVYRHDIAQVITTAVTTMPWLSVREFQSKNDWLLLTLNGHYCITRYFLPGYSSFCTWGLWVRLLITIPSTLSYRPSSITLRISQQGGNFQPSSDFVSLDFITKNVVWWHGL